MIRLQARDRLLTLKEAAVYTGLAPRTIQYAAETGRLAFSVLSGSIRPNRRFRMSDLDRLVVDRRAGERAAGRGPGQAPDRGQRGPGGQ